MFRRGAGHLFLIYNSPQLAAGRFILIIKYLKIISGLQKGTL
jgi:hypothetical protein